MTRTRIYLMRHGQVEGHEEKRYNGQGEVLLTDQGEAQFGLLKLRLEKKPLKAVYSSDLSRCRQGAETVASGHALETISLPELRELHIGDWEGMTWKEIQRLYPGAWQARLDDIVNYRVPNGESLLEMSQRVLPALREILARHPDEEVAIVGHGGVNRVILLDAIGAPLEQLFHVEQNFGCLNIIDYFPDGRAVVQLLNG